MDGVARLEEAASKHSPVVVITGASSGIGAAVGEELAKRGGYRVALIARRKAALQEVAAKCPGAYIVVADMTVKDQVDAAAAAIVHHFGTIDIWINNAGLGLFKSATELTEIDVLSMIRANLITALFGTQAALRVMKMHGKGQVIDVNSVAGRHPSFSPMTYKFAAYAASKHSLHSLTGSFRAELKNSHPGIVFSAFSPGPVGTDLVCTRVDSTFANSRTFNR